MIWILSYLKDRAEKEERKARFKSVVWTELFQVSQALVKEHAWWVKRLDDLEKREPQIIVSMTNPRAVEQYQLPILLGNIDRITDFKPEIADVIGVVLASLRALPAILREYYRTEDDMERHIREKRIPYDSDEVHRIQSTNALHVSKEIASVAYSAFDAARLLDKGGTEAAYLLQRSSAENWQEQLRAVNTLKKWMKANGMEL